MIGNHEAVQRVKKQRQNNQKQLQRIQHRFRQNPIEEINYRVEILRSHCGEGVEKEVLHKVVADGEDARQRMELVKGVIIALEPFAPACLRCRSHAHRLSSTKWIIPTALEKIDSGV
jgi:hypothetical protein